jgi:hypothetical protein
MSVVSSSASPPQAASGGTLADVVGLILDKGLVIDIYVRVSLVGIEILTIDARVVVASVDTYLRFAEAAGRLNLEASQKPGLPELIYGVASGRSRSKAPAELEPADEVSQLLADPADQRVSVPRSSEQEGRR